MPEETDIEKRIREAEADLRALRYEKVSTERNAARKCYWCGCTDDENDYKYGWGSLIDMHLEVCVGEEGYSNIVRYVCGGCCDKVVKELQQVGFKQHYHGGTCLMQDDDCPGANDMDKCPTPEDPWEIKVWPM